MLEVIDIFTVTRGNSMKNKVIGPFKSNTEVGFYML